MSIIASDEQFNYAFLDPVVRDDIVNETIEIKKRINRTSSDLTEIGERLTRVKERLGHGQFGLWLHAEFGWSDRTAQNLMSVADSFKSEIISLLPIIPTALTVLAAPSVPQSARDEAIRKATAGEKITVAVAKEIIANHKPAPASRYAREEIKTQVIDPPVTGQSRVNGVLRPDPPAIAALRDKIGMPANYVPDVSEPLPAGRQPGDDDDDEPLPDYPEAEATVSDSAWLASLPLSGKLAGQPLAIFTADAMLWRKLETYRRTFAIHAGRAMKQGRGDYRYHLKRFLSINSPKDWLLCPATEHGGCGGTGSIPFFGDCPKCRGRGYFTR